ncbi:hypothetical protein [Actinocrispum sp. NPDC049592]|uniref:hypothetical protein n=1 Tax=Actinocrispum sp. NPDC049592 TaxID=3154835 RepID=UPI003427E4F0
MRNTLRLAALSTLVTSMVLPAALPANAESCSWQLKELASPAFKYVTDAAEGGWIVGSTDPSQSVVRQIRWRPDGTFEALGKGRLYRVNSSGVAISSEGTIVYADRSVKKPALPDWLGDMQLTAINNNGDVVGFGHTKNGQTDAARWSAADPGTAQRIPMPAGYSYLVPLDIDDQGNILFQAQAAGGAGFVSLVRQANGQVRQVVDPNGGGTINPHRIGGGKIVGTSSADGNVTWRTTQWNLDGAFLFAVDNSTEAGNVYINSSRQMTNRVKLNGKYQIGVYGDFTQTILGGEFDGAVPTAITDDGVITAQIYSGGGMRAATYKWTCK